MESVIILAARLTALKTMTALPNNSTDSSSRNSGSWLTAIGVSTAALIAAAKLGRRVRHPVHLRGKVALITGGSRGLGLALAHELGTYGCRVALVARDERELEEAANRLRAKGIEAAVFPCDITNESALNPLIDRVTSQFGRIDILVNDAGLIKVAPLESLEHGDFEQAMDLMFWAPVNLTLAVLPRMNQQSEAHIVNITSVGARVSVPHLIPYSCAKFAFLAFSTGLSSELDPHKVHVLTVVPGLMRTGSYLHAAFKGAAEREFAWFSILGNLPGATVSAEYAARAIRESLQRRQLTCTISLPAKLLIHSEALMPEATRAAMQFASRFLLPSSSKRATKAGKALNPKFGRLFQALTILGRTAAAALNE